ncbi:UNVERIFIED_CONTAM: hypothetical protein Scaly_1264600 [Sesamum calycinum]|uniref:VWFA domain-containing protein n=1 Tax=Sesamum calycinum TaxID=2727403 RepID=A0AAW2Q5M1_9LAMI
MGGGGGGASWKLKKAARKIFVQTCGSFCQRHQAHVLDNSTATTVGLVIHPIILPRRRIRRGTFLARRSPQKLRSRGIQLTALLLIRRSFLRSARYDDDDPIEPDHASNEPRLHLSLLTVPLAHASFNLCRHQASASGSCHHCGTSSHHSSVSSSMAGSPLAQHFPSTGETPFLASPNNNAYLRVQLARQPATDLVLVASPNGPHLRLMKQAMALVVFSLRPVDRLAIVTYSSAAARVFPLRRMTSYGKRTALQVIDRLFYMGHADPMEGLKKGVKILQDRVHKNPESCILHLTDSPARSYHQFDMEVPVTIHRFHVGFGFGTSNGFVMHEFEEFLARTLGGAIRDVQLRIDEGTRIVRIGELREGEERNIPVYLGDCGPYVSSTATLMVEMVNVLEQAKLLWGWRIKEIEVRM